VIVLRQADTSDQDILWLALSQAASAETETDAREAAHEIRHYVEGWGREGDLAVVATDDDVPVGAAWVRLMKAGDPGYGFVAADIPELGIGIVRDHRGQGLGGRLIDALLDVVSAQFGAVSLSSLETNAVAIRLYESRGFRKVAHADGAYTMLLEF
jgi:ribosomal protein S18 acetylase RimI-like enzyme